MKTHPIAQLTLIAILILAFAFPAAAQGPVPDGPAGQPPIDAAPSSPDAAPQKAPDGHWFMPASSRPDAAAASAPQGSGGPDDFGYTWTDNVPLSWVNASSGTDTGINNTTDRAGPIDIGFPFKFYENVRSQVYISRSGFLAFNSDNPGNSQPKIPDPSSPNEVIAPYWVTVDTWGPENAVDYVRYLRGGSAPNRWFAVEWNHVRGHCCSGDGADEYTFETILHESGNIIFQYAAMTERGSAWCSSSGIEDATGLDGLEITPYCSRVAPNHAVRITRPAPAARAALLPKAQGAFGAAGASVQFNQTVRNTGELGADTFDLTVSSSWPTTLYQADGSTPLTDTDSDGMPDTGSVDQGDSTTIVVKTALPAGAAAGDSNTAQVTTIPSRNPAVLKTARFQTAVPASFAQIYALQSGWLQPSRPKVGFYRPSQQITCETTDQRGWGSAVATAPDGSIVQVGRQSRRLGNDQTVWELYHSVLDRRCNVIRPATRITDLEGAVTTAYDLNPSIAVAPDGRTGITWRRRLWNSSTGTENNNIYFLMLDGNGATLVLPLNLTNNEGWGTSSTPNVPQFYSPTIATTADGRFGLAWYRQLYDGNSGTWYAVRGADGDQVKAPTQFSASTSSSSLNLTPLADGTLFLILAQLTANQLSYGRIDRDGNIVAGPTTLSASNPTYPDAVQLPNGNIVLVWSNWSGSIHSIAYAVLNGGLGIVKVPTSLPNISPMDDNYVSVTRSRERAVLTWLNTWSSQPSLCYALLDGSGNVLTPPMIFFSGCAGCSVSLPSNGQGNTPLLEDLTPPANPTSLTSPSHATGTWSNDNTIDVAWTAASDDDSGVDGYSVLWDHASTTVPDTTKDIGTLTAATSPVLADGDWYFHIRAVDEAGNWAHGAAHLGPFKIDATPPACRMQSPAYNLGAFTVSWYATDAGSGVSQYDIWERTTGPFCETVWTRWIAGTTALNAPRARGCSESTAHFNCLATDRAGNTADEQPPVEDAATIQADYMAAGRVTNNRGQPVFRAQVTTTPAAMNTAWTDGAGRYALYFGFWTGQTYGFSASRSGYGTLPAQRDVAVNGQPTGVDFVLPPEQDAVVNGGFETGNLSGWQTEPGASATVEAAAAHTGLGGLRLVSPATASSALVQPLWQISQTITLPVSLTAPTLSWLTQVVSGDPADSLLVEVSAGSDAITHTIPLAPGGWMHAWEDLSAFSGQTATLRVGFLEASAREVYLDEVSIGATQVGVDPVRLPLIARQ